MKFRRVESFFPTWNGKNERTHWQYPKICTLCVVCCVLLYKTSGQFCRKFLGLFRHHWHNRIIASVSGMLPLWICVIVSHAPTRTDIITTAKNTQQKMYYIMGRKEDNYSIHCIILLYMTLHVCLKKKLWWDLVTPSNLIEIQYCWCLALTKYWNLCNRNRKRREKVGFFSIYCYYDGNIIWYPAATDSGLEWSVLIPIHAVVIIQMDSVSWILFHLILRSLKCVRWTWYIMALRSRSALGMLLLLMKIIMEIYSLPLNAYGKRF